MSIVIFRPNFEVSKNLIIVPTYNEIENIRLIVEAILKESDSFDVLVVDDGSPDGTATEVKVLQSENEERIHLIERSGKLGLGTAYITGFKFGIENNYDYIFEMDADFSHPVSALKPMLDLCSQEETGVVVGSRYVKGGDISNWSTYRLMLSFGASIYVRLITGMRVKDPTAGFVCYRRKVLETMDLDAIRFIGYAFQIEMKYYATRLGFTIKEFPITFIDRELGTSKMDTSIFKEAVIGVLKMRMRAYLPKK